MRCTWYTCIEFLSNPKGFFWGGGGGALFGQKERIKEKIYCFTDLVSKPSSQSRGGSRIFFLGGGALVSCSTSTPINHIVFFGRIPVVLENRRSSRWGGGGGTSCTLPLDPPLSESVRLVFTSSSRPIIPYWSRKHSHERNSIGVVGRTDQSVSD